MTFTEWLQLRLNVHGAAIEVDGAMGSETRNAIKGFQRRRKLNETGLADAATVTALREVPGRPDSSIVPAVHQTMPPWLEEMTRRLGLHEERNNSTLMTWLRSGRFLGNPAKLPWCGDAVETCFARTLPEELVPANPFFAQAWADFGRSCSVSVGAVGVIRWSARTGHVGFIIDWSQDKIKLRGGNQSDSIRDAWFPRKKFIAFRWPLTYTFREFPRISGAAASNVGTR